MTLLEQLPVYSECSGSVVLYHDILPMLYLALESSMSQVNNREGINTANVIIQINITSTSDIDSSLKKKNTQSSLKPFINLSFEGSNGSGLCGSLNSGLCWR